MTATLPRDATSTPAVGPRSRSSGGLRQTWAGVNGSPASANNSITGSASVVISLDLLMQLAMDRTVARVWLPRTTNENVSGPGRSGQTDDHGGDPDRERGPRMLHPAAIPALTAIPVTPANAMARPSSAMSRGAAAGRPSTSPIR